MDAVLLHDVYASQVGALPWNIDDYVIAPQGTVVTIEALDDRGVHCAALLAGRTIGLTLPVGAVEEIEPPDMSGWRISEPELPAFDGDRDRYRGWRQ